jgi:hypothetical protein
MAGCLVEWLIRFLLGGTVVSLFAPVADILRPRKVCRPARDMRKRHS